MLKDHEIAQLVNELRDVAVEFHATQQLRERIARLVLDALQKERSYGVLSDPRQMLADEIERLRAALKTENK